MKRLTPRITVGPEPTTLRDDALHLQQPVAEGPFVFGDGSHPTTRCCAGAVDLLCRTTRPRAVLDVGTGTGVLARIARLRGVPFVAGTDIDAASLQLARSLSMRDGVSTPIHFGNEPPDHWGARFDLVVANILAEPLSDLAPALARALTPQGRLLISGFTPLQAPGLHVQFDRAGLEVRREARLDGWLLIELSLERDRPLPPP